MQLNLSQWKIYHQRGVVNDRLATLTVYFDPGGAMAVFQLIGNVKVQNEMCAISADA